MVHPVIKFTFFTGSGHSKPQRTNKCPHCSYGLGWMESSSKNLGFCSRWDHLMASYVTSSNESNTFLKVFKILKIETNRNVTLNSDFLKIFFNLGFFKNNYKCIESVSQCDIGNQEVIPYWEKNKSLRARSQPSYTVNFCWWPFENAELDRGELGEKYEGLRGEGEGPATSD